MSTQPFIPHHINAEASHLAGNQGLGRYIFLPGSDGRARRLADHFEDVVVQESARGHHLYLGRLPGTAGPVDVAAVASGMGTPSLDIIVNELIKLGGRRFLRVGTAGSLQPHRIRVGALVVATGAVRDENASKLYVPAEYPAMASPAMVAASLEAAATLGLEERLFQGVIHSKDSLFAREFGEGPMAAQNRAYMEILEEAGVVASEMESSHLFVLASLATHQLRLAGTGPAHAVLAGTVLAIIGDDRPFAPKEEAVRTVTNAVMLSLETIRCLAAAERVQG